jgi:hypothetical protein
MQNKAIDIVKTWAYQNLDLDCDNKFIVVHINRSSYVVSDNIREDRPDDNDGDMYFLSYIDDDVDVSIFLGTNGDVFVARDRIDEKDDPSLLIGSINDIIDGKALFSISRLDNHDPRTDSETTRQ